MRDAYYTLPSFEGHSSDDDDDDVGDERRNFIQLQILEHFVQVCNEEAGNQTASPRILLKTCSSAAKPQHPTVSFCVPCVFVSAPTQIKIEISQPAGLAVWLVGSHVGGSA